MGSLIYVLNGSLDDQICRRWLSRACPKNGTPMEYIMLLQILQFLFFSLSLFVSKLVIATYLVIMKSVPAQDSSSR